MREWTIDGLHTAYRNGETDPVAVCRQYLDRIEEIDRSGPSVNSIIEVNLDAITEAQRSRRAFSGERRVGLLQGIPVLLKDNIDTGDRMKTTAGTLGDWAVT